MRVRASEKEERKGGGESKRVYVRQGGREVGEESKRVCVTGVEEGKVGGRAREWE